MKHSLLSRVVPIIAVGIVGASCGESTNPAGPTQLGVTISQLSITAGANLPIQVVIQDASGTIVAGSTAPITIALGANPAGATLLGDLTVNAVDGVATFTDARITKAGLGYTIVATSSGLASATTPAFQIVHDVAAKIAFLSQPSAVPAGSAIPSVRVAVQDQFDNVASSASGGVTIALASNPGGATLSGTTVAAFSSGIATFADLSINKVAPNYTLSATSGSFAPVTSAEFAVSAGAPAKLAFEPIGASFQSMALIGNPLRVRIL